MFFPNGAVGLANSNWGPKELWDKVGQWFRLASGAHEPKWADAVRTKNWHVEIQNGHLLLYRRGNTRAKDCPNLLEEGYQIATQLRQSKKLT